MPEITLKPLRDDEQDPALLWAEIHTLRAAIKGPDGFDTWKDAAINERVRRMNAERQIGHSTAQVEQIRRDAVRDALGAALDAMKAEEIPRNEVTSLNEINYNYGVYDAMNAIRALMPKDEGK